MFPERPAALAAVVWIARLAVDMRYDARLGFGNCLQHRRHQWPKHDNVVALYVEDHAIIADAETVAAEFRVGQPFGVLEGIVFEAKEGRADAFLTPASSLLISLTALWVYTSR